MDVLKTDLHCPSGDIMISGIFEQKLLACRCSQFCFAMLVKRTTSVLSQDWAAQADMLPNDRRKRRCVPSSAVAKGFGCQLLQSTQTLPPVEHVEHRLQFAADQHKKPSSRPGLFDVDAQLLLEGCDGMTLILLCGNSQIRPKQPNSPTELQARRRLAIGHLH